MSTSVACAVNAYKILSAGSPATDVPWYWFGYATPTFGQTNHTFNSVATFFMGTDWQVTPGQPCPEGTSSVAMSVGDYNAMIGGAAVNETLSIGLVCLMAALGLALGYYVFGPRRRSIVDITS